MHMVITQEQKELKKFNRGTEDGSSFFLFFKKKECIFDKKNIL